MNEQKITPCEDISSGAMPEIFQLIDELKRRFSQFQGMTLREAGLTPPQYYILSLLSERDGRPFKELAGALACTPATMTGIVDTLEKKGLTTRNPNPTDRRSLLVRLTPMGRNLVGSTPGLEQTFGSCCCEALPPDEARELVRLLKKLAQRLPF